MIRKREKVNKNRKKISEKLERKFFIFYSCTIQLSKMIRKKKKIFRTKHADNMRKRTLVTGIHFLSDRPSATKMKTIRHRQMIHPFTRTLGTDVGHFQLSTLLSDRPSATKKKTIRLMQTIHPFTRNL